MNLCVVYLFKFNSASGQCEMLRLISSDNAILSFV